MSMKFYAIFFTSSFSCYVPDITKNRESDHKNSFFFLLLQILSRLDTLEWGMIEQEEEEAVVKEHKVQNSKERWTFHDFSFFFILLVMFFLNQFNIFSSSPSFHAHQMRFSADNDSVNIEKNVYSWWMCVPFFSFLFWDWDFLALHIHAIFLYFFVLFSSFQKIEMEIKVKMIWWYPCEYICRKKKYRSLRTCRASYIEGITRNEIEIMRGRAVWSKESFFMSHRKAMKSWFCYLQKTHEKQHEKV